MRRKTTTMLSIEDRYGMRIEELLRKWYVDEGATQAIIAQRIGVGTGTVCKWMKRFGISLPETKK